MLVVERFVERKASHMLAREPLIRVHRNRPAAAHRVRRQGTVPGGEGPGDGSGAGSVQRKRLHHLRGA